MTTLSLSARLDRTDSSTSWGFRMHGGKDFGAPLTIQKVRFLWRSFEVGSQSIDNCHVSWRLAVSNWGGLCVVLLSFCGFDWLLTYASVRWTTCCVGVWSCYLYQFISWTCPSQYQFSPLWLFWLRVIYRFIIQLGATRQSFFVLNDLIVLLSPMTE